MGTAPDRGNSELNAARAAAHNFVSVDGRTGPTDGELPLSHFNTPDADSLAHAPFDLASFPDEVAVPTAERVATLAAPPAAAAVVPLDTTVLRLPNGLIVRTTRRPHRRRRSAKRVARRALLAVDAAAADLVLALHRTTRRVQRRGRIALANVDTRRLFTRSSVRGIAIVAVSLMTLGGLMYFSRPNAPATTAPAATAPPHVAVTPSRAAAPAPSTALAPVARVSATETPRARETGVTATTGARPARTAKAEPRRSVETTPTVGSLNITSQPAGAQVSVNGVRHGQTPVVIRGLRAGSRVVSLSLPGYERWSWSVAVVADRLTPVNVKLQRDAPSALRH
jgi:PEGA domain-containing protein